jgi:hypothetical protein
VLRRPGAAYLITKPPDFDHLLSVTLDHKFPAEELNRGIRLTFPGRANTAAQRLAEAPLTAQVVVPGREAVRARFSDLPRSISKRGS